MNKLTKSDMVDSLVQTLTASGKDLSKNTVSEVLDLVADFITKTLKNGDSVNLQGVANFSVKTTKAKSGTAPNGVTWTKPAGKSVKVTASKTLKDALDG